MQVYRENSISIHGYHYLMVDKTSYQNFFFTLLQVFKKCYQKYHFKLVIMLYSVSNKNFPTEYRLL